MELTRRPDPRLGAYTVAGALGLVAAVVLGEPALLVTAAPFAALAAIGSTQRTAPIRNVTVALDTHRLVEGDVLGAVLTLHAEGTGRHDVVVATDPGAGLTFEAPQEGAHVVTGGGPVEVAVRLRAASWGRHRVGTVHVRSRRPWGLWTWDAVAVVDAEVRVLPSTVRVSALLSPDDPRGLAGPHRSRARGHGSDLAELRPYQPGDRLRDVSWAATARTGNPWVAEHHPERTGTVVLLVDSVGDGTGAAGSAFGRLAGVAWSVASAHLRVGDRVGILSTGSNPVWLAPEGGRRARLQVLDAILAMHGAASLRRPRRPVAGSAARPQIPTDALVVGITMLQSEAFLAQLARHRRHGSGTVALALDPVTTVPAGADPVERAARRLWRAELDVRRADLARAGVPSAVLGDVSETATALSALRRRARRPALRRPR